MPVEKYEVRFSETEGRYMAATQDMRQGEEILVLPTATLENPDMYSLEIHPGLHIDCANSPAGALNHSCDANAAVRGNRIIAWNCIKAGEPITLDYKKTEQRLAVPFNCLCGSKNCRGRIE